MSGAILVVWIRRARVSFVDRRSVETQKKSASVTSQVIQKEHDCVVENRETVCPKNMVWNGILVWQDDGFIHSGHNNNTSAHVFKANMCGARIRGFYCARMPLLHFGTGGSAKRHRRKIPIR